MGKVRYSFNTLNHSVNFGLPATLPEQIVAAAACGYDHVGLDLPSVLAHERQGLEPAALAAIMQANSITCHELVPLWLSSNTRRCESTLADIVRVARHVKPWVVYAIAQEPPDPHMATNFRRCASVLAELDMGCAIEFVAGWGVDTIHKALSLAVAAGDRVGVVLDSWQFFRAGSTWTALAQLPADRIAFVQIADAPAAPQPDLTFEMSHQRLMPGRGGLDLLAFRDALLNRGYDGVVSVEVLSEEWRTRPLEEFAETTLATAKALWQS